MMHFLNGYYGAAGDYLYRYIKVMEGALLGSGLRLWRNFADRSYGLFLFWNAGGIEKAKCEHQS